MASTSGKPVVYQFGVFTANPSTGELLKKGIRIKLQDQPFRLLCLFLERSGGIVSKEDVRERLWPGNTFVEFDASLSVAVGKVRDALGDDSDAPRFIETIPRKGYRFIAPVENVLQEPEIVEQAYPPQSSPAGSPAVPHARFKPVAAARVLLVCAVAIFLGAALLFRTLHQRSTSTAEPKTAVQAPQIRKSVAVLGFRNLPGRKDDDWLSQAFSEMISTELAAGGEVRVVSDEDVARAKRELPFENGETLGKSTLEQLRKNPGTDVVVVGSFTTIPAKNGDRIRLDIRLQDTVTGETIAEDAVTGGKDDLFELATRAGSHLREHLGMGGLPPANENTLGASLPSNQNAIRYYAEGKEKLWNFDLIGARDLLVKAVAADPKYPLAHAALSSAWELLGYRSKAAEEAKLALDLSGNLPQGDKLKIEAAYWQLSNNLPKAADAERTLFQMHPESLEYGLDLARVQSRSEPEDALATLQVLRKLPAPAGDDPRIDLVEASAQVTQNIVLARSEAQRALAKGTALGSPFIVARAYGILCQQDSAVGVSIAENIADCEHAKGSYASQGDRNNEARTLNDMAVIYYQRGDLHKAEGMWREAANVFRHNGEVEGLAATSNNIADAFLKEGRLSEAKKMLQDAVPGYQAAQDVSGLSLALNDLAEVSRLQGNLAHAETIYQQALAAANQVGDKSTAAYVDSGLGDVRTDRGDLAGARKFYEQSLVLRTQTGEQDAAAETQVHLANVSIEEGRALDAERSLRRSITQFHNEQEADEELIASIVLIQGLLAQGKVADAKSELEREAPLAAKSQNFLARLQFELVSALELSASGDAKAALPKLSAALQKARQHGYVASEFECRLAIAKLGRKSGDPSAAQAQSNALERDAYAKGFALIARKAAADRT